MSDADADLLHGGSLPAVMERYPGAPTPWIDLSTGINPWPYPDTQIDPANLRNLPDRTLQERAYLAAVSAYGCRTECLVLTAGSQSAIQLAPALHPARRVAIVSPTYSEHALSWARSGAEIVEVPDLPDDADAFDAVIAVNPNNPDGRIHTRADLLHLAASLHARGGCLIVDEAFADLDPAISVADAAGTPGLIVLRSFGKFYGLAGLRLGAIIAPPEQASCAASMLGPWPVSGPALEIATRAYEDNNWQTETRTRLALASSAVDKALTSANIAITGGTHLFRWLHLPNAHTTWLRLAQSGLYTRRFPWTDNHLRIGLPASDEVLKRLIEAF